MVFELSANVQVRRDDEGHVRVLRHSREPYAPERAGLAAPSPRELADRYVREVAPIYEIEEEQLADLTASPTRQPIPEATRLRRAEEKTTQGITVVTYQQTRLGLPIWQAAFEVRMYGDPIRVASSSSTLHRDVELEPPPAAALESFTGDDPGALARSLGLEEPAAGQLAVSQSRLLIYRYDPNQRFDPTATPAGEPETLQATPPVLPLPPVPDTIQPGRHYVVREVLFTLSLPDWGGLNWRAFVEPETGAVLYLRALVASATGCVFRSDPVTLTGNSLTGCSPATDLDPLRTNVTLLGLVPPDPVSGQQALSGNFVTLAETDLPTVPAPTTTTPFVFCYSAVTDDFAATSAYHHYDANYRLLEGMGFNIATYFDGTAFPVPVDHQGFGASVNAAAHGNALGNGMGRYRNGLAAAGCPVGIAADVRVVLHEFGHALLWDHVSSPNFGFCHSAGDTLGAILHDPGSLAPDRFVTFPFVNIGRRHDRDVAAGWAWGGMRDDTQYGSEQILSTLLFRVYRSTGGDDTDINLQRFAARYLVFLIVTAIGTLTVTTTDPEVLATALMDADESTLDFEGHPGGAWHKVIRWSFEQQGLYQLPGAPTPVSQPGAPPPVDVYIDDGRNGGYMPYLSDVAASTDIWNRNAADGAITHEEPVVGQTGYVYVRVRNRGTQSANNVVVNLYQGDPASPLMWPADWQATSTPQVAAAGPIAPGGETIVGPFEWKPTVVGQEALLASASVPGDLSNADTVNGSIPHWRLVPFDNNIAQRNIAPTEPVVHPSSGFATQGRFGTKGNFEVVAPRQSGRLAHFWRDNDAAGLPWHGPTPFGSTEVYDAVALIQSNFSTAGAGPGNLEVIAHTGNRLDHYWRDDVNPFPWHGPFAIPGSTGTG